MRHVTRLALMLVLLGIAALFQVESVQASCQYPHCEALYGTRCNRGGAKTTCAYSDCIPLQCTCSGLPNFIWLCP